jgi:hypothetical protein
MIFDPGMILDPTYTLTITNVPSSGAGDEYNGRWKFDVTLDAKHNTLKLIVVSGNTPANTAEFAGVTYSFTAVQDAKNVYVFSGTSLGTRTKKNPPPYSDYNLGVFGVFDPSTRELVFTGSVTSQQQDGATLSGPVYEFTFTNVRLVVPEPPTSVLGLVAVGIVGAGFTLRRQSKPERGPAREGRS